MPMSSDRARKIIIHTGYHIDFIHLHESHWEVLATIIKDMDLSLLEEFATDIVSQDVFIGTVSNLSLTDILYLSKVSRSLYNRLKEIAKRDDFWKRWVTQSLFPRHDTDIIEKIPGTNKWHYYARLHGVFAGTEIYSSNMKSANKSDAGILSRFYPLFSEEGSNLPKRYFSVVRKHSYVKKIVAISEGQLGFISHRGLFEGEWVSYEHHQVPGESYVDCFLLREDEMQMCLLTDRGRVYRMKAPDFGDWKDSVPTADIEGLLDNDIIVQISPLYFLTRRGEVYFYNSIKVKLETRFKSPVIRLALMPVPTTMSIRTATDSSKIHSKLPPHIYFSDERQHLRVGPNEFVWNWDTGKTANISVSKNVPSLPAPVRGLVATKLARAAWTTNGDLFTSVWQSPQNGGNNRSTAALGAAVGIPDFTVSAEVEDHRSVVAIALPRIRNSALRDLLSSLSFSELITLMKCRMFTTEKYDEETMREFLLREPLEEIQPLLQHLSTIEMTIKSLLSKSAKDLKELLEDRKVPNFRVYTKEQAAARLAMLAVGPDLFVEAPKSRIEAAPSAIHDEESDLLQQKLSKLLLGDLKSMAKAHGIKGFSKMKKADLVAALIAVLSQEDKAKILK